MTPFLAGFLMGAPVGAVLAVALMQVYAWWQSRPEKVDIDRSIERFRKL